MLTDLQTILWKEFKEIFLQRGSLRGGIFNVAVMVLIIGVFFPWQMGREWLENPLGLLTWSWLPLMLVMNSICDAISGERERHTLETLLSSRLSDKTILVGKAGAAVLYGWGTAMICVLVSVVTVNLMAGANEFLFFPVDFFATAVCISLLLTFLITWIGMLVSIHAETVKQASQRLSIGFLVIWMIPFVGLQVLPDPWKTILFHSLSRLGNWQAVLGFMGLLVIANVILFAIVISRFQRSKLMLD
jgi:ABC-2 type transport system permease protein